MVRIFKNSRTDTFYGHYFDKKKQRRVQFSCKTGNRRTAELFAQEEYLKRTNSGTLSDKPTIKVFAEEYLNTLRKTHSVKTIETYKDSFVQFEKRIGNLELHEINAKVCQHFIYTEQPSLETAAKHFRTLRRAFKIALRWGYVFTNPFEIFDAPRTLQKKKDYFTEEEFKYFIEAIPSSTFASRRMKRMFVLAKLTGLRETELLSLHREYLDANRKLLYIVNDESRKLRTKSGKNRAVPLSENAIEIIDSQIIDNQSQVKEIQSSPYVFPNQKGGRMSLWYSTQYFRFWRQQIFPERHRITFHSLRATFITKALLDNVPSKQVQLVVGHWSVATTESYANLERMKFDDLLASVEKQQRYSV